MRHPPTGDQLDPARHAAMLANGQIGNHYQPIVDLQTGRVIGVEVMARLTDGQQIIPPSRFLPGMGVEALAQLLFASLPVGLAALAACAATHPELTISFNVSPSVMLRAGFREMLLQVLDQSRTGAHRVVLEVLEDDEFFNFDIARTQLVRLRECGLRMALDDVGSGYSSLARMRDLPIQIIKLDQGFVRSLRHQPEHLQFVAAMQSLARGLRADLVVEGVETPDILDALAVMGIGAAQGYAIARPMPERALIAWLADHQPRRAGRQPNSLLAAYGAHLGIVEACRALMNQPLRACWSDDVRDPHACAIGKFFDARQLHGSKFGEAHKRFHSLIDRYQEDPEAWEAAANDLWRSLQTAIRAEAEEADQVRLAPDAGSGVPRPGRTRALDASTKTATHQGQSQEPRTRVSASGPR